MEPILLSDADPVANSTDKQFDHRDYHLRLLIEQMERDGRSKRAIDTAVREASGLQDPSPRHEQVDRSGGCRCRPARA
jgi:hypothetical protein